MKHLKRNLTLWTLMVSVSIAVFITPVTTANTKFTKVVNTTYGPVRGEATTLPTNKTVERFLGIPYAKANRFENPTDPAIWSAIRDSVTFGKRCPQPSRDPHDPLATLGTTSEDCLTVNLFVPSNIGNNLSNLAVMLWIHGGAYAFGGSPRFDGGALATEGDVVVVTCNYRVGALGFLSTKSDDLQGNYGMMDQIHAMKWVQQNIRRFGGNPDNVTLFGESAGGMSISLLMLSPLTRGLYKNVILQSGAATALYTALLPNEAKERARKFATALGCDDLSTLKQCAKRKNIPEIITAQIKVKSAMLLSPFAPVVIGPFLSDSPSKLLDAGHFQATGSAMVGVTRDEGSRFTVYLPGVIDALDVNNGLNDTTFHNIVRNSLWIRNQNEEVLQAILYKYTDWTNANDANETRRSFLDVHADAAYKAPAIFSAMSFARKGLRTFFYQMDYSSSSDSSGSYIPEWKRVFHAADIQYVFGTPLMTSPSQTNDTDVAFSIAVMKYWTNFAKTGNPNSRNQRPMWSQYSSEKQYYMSLQPTMTLRSHLLADRMAFWNNFLPNLSGKSTVIPTTQSTRTSNPQKTEDAVIGLSVAVGILVIVVFILVIMIICMRLRISNKDHGYDL